MPKRSFLLIVARIIALLVMAYGLSIIAGTFIHQLQLHGRHGLHDATLLVSLPSLIGLSYFYLGTLLLRQKYNAWLTAVALSALTVLLNIAELLRPRLDDASTHGTFRWLRVGLPLAVLMLLAASRQVFRVRSDIRSFRQSARTSVLVLLIALLYGVGGFMVFDKHDFHQEIGLATAVHQTVDQFGLTTTSVTPYTRRARLFVDSLSTISIGAVAYAAISFFQPLRMRLASEASHRRHAEELLRAHPGDLDDFFKLWPHDKHYYFDATARAGLAYHVARGVALVVGDPFGDPKRFRSLITAFQELCYVNDWTPGFIHITDKHAALYRRLGFRLQKLGEEAVLDLTAFQAIKDGKYFRQIRNRYAKLGYSVELLKPPHSQALLNRLRAISDEWLRRPGRAERGLMMGYFTNDYLQTGPVAIARDDAQQIQGFINLVPTYSPHSANYDLLRCADDAPGNCNDFLLLGLIDRLYEEGYKTLNLGLCPLSGLDEKADNASLIDTGLRFVYANGDRFYSFSGLRRFKAKYEPAWENRYVAYPGGIRTFTRIMTALTRAMRVK